MRLPTVAHGEACGPAGVWWAEKLAHGWQGNVGQGRTDPRDRASRHHHVLAEWQKEPADPEGSRRDIFPELQCD